jgi:hypothetical protein
MTPFSALIASLQNNAEGHSISLPPDWLQGRTTFGASYGEGKVQGVVKATQTGILWSQVQVLVGPPI